MAAFLKRSELSEERDLREGGFHERAASSCGEEETEVYMRLSGDSFGSHREVGLGWNGKPGSSSLKDRLFLIGFGSEGRGGGYQGRGFGEGWT